MIINGKEYNFKEGQTLEELLIELGVNLDRVVVEIDGVIITSEDFYKTSLKESNVMEVISFVGGG